MHTVEYQYLFSYRPLFYESNGQPMLTEPRPAIFITPHRASKHFHTMALIDSGSTFSLFDNQVGVELGSDVQSGRPHRLSSLGGSVMGYAHVIELEIVPSWRFETEVLFSDQPVPRNLLGHYGFLEQTAVGLHGRTGSICLRNEIS